MTEASKQVFLVWHCGDGEPGIVGAFLSEEAAERYCSERRYDFCKLRRHGLSVEECEVLG